jgi:hypothetical protein
MRALIQWLGLCVMAGAIQSVCGAALPAADGGDRYTAAEHVERAECIREGVPLAFCGRAVLLGTAASDAGARPTPPGNPPVRAQSSTQRGIK